MELKNFKQEFRLICDDTWGTAMDSWFECAGRLWMNGQPIPSEWQYSTGATNEPCEEDSYFYEIFLESSNEDLMAIGNFLFRYCQYLEFKGMSY